MRPTILGDERQTIVVARLPEEYLPEHAIWNTMEANARLIAKAPELLARLVACEACLTNLVDGNLVFHMDGDHMDEILDCIDDSRTIISQIEEG